MSSKPDPLILKQCPDPAALLERHALRNELNTLRKTATTIDDLNTILNLLNLIDQTQQ
jgi:hypothetical protein